MAAITDAIVVTVATTIPIIQARPSYRSYNVGT
jgi:hypothetical protein